MLKLVVVLLGLVTPQLSSAAQARPDPVTSLTLTGGVDDPTVWAASCATTVTADFLSRDALPEYKNDSSWGTNSWGPYPNTYPAAPTISAVCDRTTWARKRVLAVIDKNTKRGLNYCHHHVPGWLPPAPQAVIDPSTIAGSGSTGVCSAAGKGADGKVIFKGFDCSHFSSWVYNYGLGAYLATGIDDQACGANAPGRLLPVSKSSTNFADVLRPGDLLYIAASSTDTPLDISHVILWTGIQLTYDNGPFSNATLIKNVPANQQGLVIKDVNAAFANKQPVWVIADSHNAGPAYRIFAGWWKRAFSHARRLINPDDSLPKTSPILQFVNGSCLNTAPGTDPVAAATVDADETLETESS